MRHCDGLSGQPLMLLHHSPSLMLSHRSSRNTRVIAGPGQRTSPAFLYTVKPAPPMLAASAPLNQLSIDMLRTRGSDCPAKSPVEGMHGYLLSPGHLQMPGLFPA